MSIFRTYTKPRTAQTPEGGDSLHCQSFQAAFESLARTEGGPGEAVTIEAEPHARRSEAQPR